jgi:hypothetical protein
VRALGLPSPKAAASGIGFSDVTQGVWYYDAVYTARGAGLLDWAADGAFRPDDAISRADMAKLVYAMCRFAEPGGAATESGDSTESGAAPEGGDALLNLFIDRAVIAESDHEAAAFCVGRGIIKGVTTALPGLNAFDPAGRTTRAQAAVVLLRTLRALGFISED